MSCTHGHPYQEYICSNRYQCKIGSCSNRRPCKGKYLLAFPCRCSMPLSKATLPPPPPPRPAAPTQNIAFLEDLLERVQRIEGELAGIDDAIRRVNDAIHHEWNRIARSRGTN